MEKPIELMSGFWVFTEECELEDIKSIFSIEKEFKNSICLKESELINTAYMNAFSKLLLESWMKTRGILLIGNYNSLVLVLKTFLTIYGKIPADAVLKIITSRLNPS